MANLLPAGELASTNCERSEQSDPTITPTMSEANSWLRRLFARVDFALIHNLSGEELKGNIVYHYSICKSLIPSYVRETTPKSNCDSCWI
jgi:hypothetical protein